jgi:hypothetical protein
MEPGILAISGNIHPYVQALEKLLRLALRWFRMVHNAQMQEMPQKTLLDIQPMSANVSTRGQTPKMLRRHLQISHKPEELASERKSLGSALNGQ